MIDGPTERLVAFPVPAVLVGVDPLPARVGAPALLDVGQPDLAVTRVVDPSPVRLEFSIENLDVHLVGLRHRRGATNGNDGQHRHQRKAQVKHKMSGHRVWFRVYGAVPTKLAPMPDVS